VFAGNISNGEGLLAAGSAFAVFLDGKIVAEESFQTVGSLEDFDG
jgi:hypothetical protein